MYVRRVQPLNSRWLGDSGESGPTVCDLVHDPRLGRVRDDHRDVRRGRCRQQRRQAAAPPAAAAAAALATAPLAAPLAVTDNDAAAAATLP